jgi:hypothetical protein
MNDHKSAINGTSSTGKTGAGSEAAEGIHSEQQQGNRGVEEKSSLEGRDAASTNESDPRRGSEPLTRTQEHKPSYGGEGGKPRKSSE